MTKWEYFQRISVSYIQGSVKIIIFLWFIKSYWGYQRLSGFFQGFYQRFYSFSILSTFWQRSVGAQFEVVFLAFWRLPSASVVKTLKQTLPFIAIQEYDSSDQTKNLGALPRENFLTLFNIIWSRGAAQHSGLRSSLPLKRSADRIPEGSNKYEKKNNNNNLVNHKSTFAHLMVIQQCLIIHFSRKEAT